MIQRAQPGIHREVIHDIIAVVAVRSRKERQQPDAGHPEIGHQSLKSEIPPIFLLLDGFQLLDMALALDAADRKGYGLQALFMDRL